MSSGIRRKRPRGLLEQFLDNFTTKHSLTLSRTAANEILQVMETQTEVCEAGDAFLKHLPPRKCFMLMKDFEKEFVHDEEVEDVEDVSALEIVGHKEECNGVLFSLETAHPRKICFNVLHDYTDETITLTMVKKAMKVASLHPLDENVGSIKEMKRSSTIRIFICNFIETTQCSHAKEGDFLRVKWISDNDRVIKAEALKEIIDNKEAHECISWSYFSECADDNKFEEVPIPVDECHRVYKLQESIISRSKDQFGQRLTVEPLRDTSKHCQFSGGGDLHILPPSTDPVTVVVYSCPQNITMSPTYDNEDTTGAALEAKNASHDVEKIKFQLFANTVIACTSQLQKKLPLWNEKTLLQLDQVSCYGVGFSFDGVFGFYKLEINFSNQKMIFVEKIPFRMFFHREVVPVLIDFALNYAMQHQHSIN